MLEIMLPNLVQAHVPVQAPVVANAPPAVNVPLVAAVVQAPAGVQQQDLVVQHDAMEVEDNNEILKRLFLQRFGRALPELERSSVDDINQAMDLIDLTKEDDEEMEVATPIVVVVKTESIETPETPEAAPIDDRRRSSRLERRGLRKSEVIPDKESPENVIADTDTDMAEDTSVGSVNAVESVTTSNNMTYEQTMAAIDAAIADN